MIIYPFKISKYIDDNIGTIKPASIAVFCTDFSYTTIEKEFWEESLINLKNSGINGIRINVVWADIEIFEGKYYLFEQNNIHKLLKYCSKIGMFVIINFIPFANIEYNGLPSYLRHIDCFNNFNNTANINHLNRFISILHNSFGDMYSVQNGPIIGVSMDFDDYFFESKTEKSKAFNEVIKIFNDNSIPVDIYWINDNNVDNNSYSIININKETNYNNYLNNYSLCNISVLDTISSNQDLIEVLSILISKGQSIFCFSDYFEICNPYNIEYNSSKIECLLNKTKNFFRAINCFEEFYVIEKEKAYNLANSKGIKSNETKLLICKDSNEISVVFNSLEFGKSIIEFCNIQILFRGVYKDKEVWLCKETELFKPQIMVDNKLINITPMEAINIITKGKVVEIFCLSKYDNRNYLVVSHNNKPYFVLSDAYLSNIENGFSVLCMGKNVDIIIWPKPSDHIFKYPNKSFESLDYVTFITKINFNKEAVNFTKLNKTQYSIDLPSSLIIDMAKLKNKKDNIAIDLILPKNANININGNKIADLNANESQIIYIKEYIDLLSHYKFIIESFDFTYKPVGHKYNCKTINFIFNN